MKEGRVFRERSEAGEDVVGDGLGLLSMLAVVFGIVMLPKVIVNSFWNRNAGNSGRSRLLCEARNAYAIRAESGDRDSACWQS